MAPLRVDVTTPSRSYAVTIGVGVARSASARMLDDARVCPRGASSCRARWSGGSTARALARALGGAEPILVPDGERFKQLPTVSRIYDALVRANADRASTLITFGGGVVGDMAGFAAATYLRGIALVHVPTTLLAQVDAAIGGKVGVNHPLGKNLIGAFYQPHAVVDRPGGARHAAAPRVPRGPVRSDQVRDDVERRRSSTASRRERKAIFAREPEALTRGDRANRAASKRASCPPTSARPGRAAS